MATKQKNQPKPSKPQGKKPVAAKKPSPKPAAKKAAAAARLANRLSSTRTVALRISSCRPAPLPGLFSRNPLGKSLRAFPGKTAVHFCWNCSKATAFLPAVRGRSRWRCTRNSRNARSMRLAASLRSVPSDVTFTSSESKYGVITAPPNALPASRRMSGLQQIPSRDHRSTGNPFRCQSLHDPT